MKFILATIIFALDVWASPRSSTAMNRIRPRQLIWILLVAFLPVVGLILWWFAGPKGELFALSLRAIS